MLHEPLHPLREPFRVIVHAEQPVRFRCQVHVCDRGDGIGFTAVRIEIRLHVFCQHIIVGVCQHDLGVKSYRWKIRFFLIRPVVIVLYETRAVRCYQFQPLAYQSEEVPFPLRFCPAFPYFVLQPYTERAFEIFPLS